MKIRIAGLLLAFAFAASALAGEVKVTLSGSEEVPPVQTEATGSGTITVNDDKTISGTITTKGVEGLAAHIHSAPKGKNGPPIISLNQTEEGVWSVPEGSKLTDEQHEAFKAGNLYVNVHSAAHKPGEIRGQIEP